MRVPFGDERATDEPAEWLNRGAQIIFIGDDEWFIRRNAFAALENFRDALACKGEGKQQGGSVL